MAPPCGLHAESSIIGAFSTVGETSAVPVPWPETVLADWLCSVGVLSPGSPPISLRLVFTMDDLCFKIQNYILIT